MMSWLRQLWDFCRRAVAIVIPFFAKASDWPWRPALVWTVRIVVVALILAGLWYLNYECYRDTFDYLRDYVPGTRGLADYHLWLPTFGLCALIFMWALYWFWKLLRGEEEVSRFDDINQAWKEATDALNRTGTDLKDFPLFLVLGRPHKSEQYFFQGAGLQFLVRQTPQREESPVHLYAFHGGKYDSIFVTCAGASILGKHGAILSGQVEYLGDEEEEGDLTKTAGINPTAERVKELIHKLQSEGLTAEEQQEYDKLVHTGRPSLIRSESLMDEARERLRYLCGLIARDRHPYCPINGVVVFLPWQATRSDQDAQETAQVCQRELAAAAKILRVHCPVWVVVSGMDEERGFAEFIARFRDGWKDRVGTSFPMRPDLESDKLPGRVEAVGSWIYRTYLPGFLRQFLSLNPAGGKVNDEVRQNGDLVRLYRSCAERQKRFGLLLSRCLYSNAKSDYNFSGCYAVALGERLGTDQAFIAGLFRKIIDKERFVSWTQEAVDEDSRYRSLTNIGYGVIGVIAAATAVTIAFFKSKS